MKILKAGTRGFYDVFTGLGWTGHTRVRWNKKDGHLQFVHGRHLSTNAVKEVLTKILEKEPPTLIVEQPKKTPHLHLVK